MTDSDGNVSVITGVMQHHSPFCSVMKIITSIVTSSRGRVSNLSNRLSVWATQIKSLGALSRPGNVQSMGPFTSRGSRPARPQPVPKNDPNRAS